MIKFIDSKRYNTETADRVADWDNDLGRNDGNFVEEELFRTAKGNWFLYGIGGALTKYARRVDQNSSCSGCDIVALNPDEAKSWLESRQCINALEEYFGETIEDA